MQFKIIEIDFRRNSSESLPMCKDAKKDPAFRGECLTKQRPTSDEYDDASLQNEPTVITGDAQNRNAIVARKPCPRDHGKDHRGVCRKVKILS